MLRPNLVTGTLLLSFALIGCGGSATTEADNTTGSAESSPSETTHPEGQSEAAALPDDDACGLLTADAIQQHVASAADAEIRVEDVTNAKRYNDDSRSCTWLWDGHRIHLQTTAEPSGNKFDTWGSRMMADRLDNRGFESVDGLGDGAGYLAKGSELFWHEGEGRIYSLSYAGPSPQASLDLDALQALAAEVGGS